MGDLSNSLFTRIVAIFLEQGLWKIANIIALAQAEAFYQGLLLAIWEIGVVNG